MITRCCDCGRAYLESDCRRIADRHPRCVSCAVDNIASAEAGRIAAAASALRAIAAIPARWVTTRAARKGN